MNMFFFPEKKKGHAESSCRFVIFRLQSAAPPARLVRPEEVVSFASLLSQAMMMETQARRRDQFG